MKKAVRYIALTFIFLTLVNFTTVVKADPPIPPAVPGSHGSGGNAGAPLDGFLGVLLLVFGVVYGGWMLYEKKKTAKEEPEGK